MSKTDAIADLLLQTEQVTPGVIKVQINDAKVPEIMEILKVFGLAKSFWNSSRKFIARQFLTERKVTLQLLPSVLFMGEPDRNGRHCVWKGTGEFVGRADPTSPLLSLEGNGSGQVWFLIDVQPVWGDIEALLESPAF